MVAVSVQEVKAESDVLLTVKHKTVLVMLGMGFTNEQIGKRLKELNLAGGINDMETGKGAVKAVMARLGCANRAEAVAVAFRFGALLWIDGKLRFR